ncbi:MAG TPA: hypothetical protein VF552_01290 [Allosphingosinicella sp.]|jgi:hypothetical protein
MTNIAIRFTAWLAAALETARMAACVQNRLEFDAPWRRAPARRC